MKHKIFSSSRRAESIICSCFLKKKMKIEWKLNEERWLNYPIILLVTTKKFQRERNSDVLKLLAIKKNLSGQRVGRIAHNLYEEHFIETWSSIWLFGKKVISLFLLNSNTIRKNSVALCNEEKRLIYGTAYLSNFQ